MSLSITTSALSVARLPSQAGGGAAIMVRALPEVVSFRLESTVTEPAVPFSPAPMHCVLLLTLVATTLVMPAPIVMSPQLASRPPPIAAAELPPVAVVEPPVIVMSPQSAFHAPPMPEELLPPVAVIVPPSTVIDPQRPLRPPPMPAAIKPPVAVIVPPVIVMSPHCAYHAPPIPAA